MGLRGTLRWAERMLLLAAIVIVTVIERTRAKEVIVSLDGANVDGTGAMQRSHVIDRGDVVVFLDDMRKLPNGRAFETCDFSEAQEVAKRSSTGYKWRAEEEGMHYFAAKRGGEETDISSRCRKEGNRWSILVRATEIDGKQLKRDNVRFLQATAPAPATPTTPGPVAATTPPPVTATPPPVVSTTPPPVAATPPPVAATPPPVAATPPPVVASPPPVAAPPPAATPPPVATPPPAASPTPTSSPPAPPPSPSSSPATSPGPASPPSPVAPAPASGSSVTAPSPTTTGNDATALQSGLHKYAAAAAAALLLAAMFN